MTSQFADFVRGHTGILGPLEQAAKVSLTLFCSRVDSQIPYEAGTAVLNCWSYLNQVILGQRARAEHPRLQHIYISLRHCQLLIEMLTRKYLAQKNPELRSLIVASVIMLVELTKVGLRLFANRKALSAGCRELGISLGLLASPPPDPAVTMTAGSEGRRTRITIPPVLRAGARASCLPSYSQGAPRWEPLVQVLESIRPALYACALFAFRNKRSLVPAALAFSIDALVWGITSFEQQQPKGAAAQAAPKQGQEDFVDAVDLIAETPIEKLRRRYFVVLMNLFRTPAFEVLRPHILAFAAMLEGKVYGVGGLLGSYIRMYLSMQENYFFTSSS